MEAKLIKLLTIGGRVALIFAIATIFGAGLNVYRPLLWTMVSIASISVTVAAVALIIIYIRHWRGLDG